MMEYQVNNKDAAYAYILDCNLATVGRMAMLKSRKKGEYKRQINIAQQMLDWANDFGIDYSGTRASDVMKVGTVKQWASKYEVY
jgi:hypothetical protein